MNFKIVIRSSKKNQCLHTQSGKPHQNLSLLSLYRFLDLDTWVFVDSLSLYWFTDLLQVWNNKIRSFSGQQQQLEVESNHLFDRNVIEWHGQRFQRWTWTALRQISSLKRQWDENDRVDRQAPVTQVGDHCWVSERARTGEPRQTERWLAGIGRKTMVLETKTGEEDDGWLRPRGPESESLPAVLQKQSSCFKVTQERWVALDWSKENTFTDNEPCVVQKTNRLWIVKWFFCSPHWGKAGETPQPFS